MTIRPAVTGDASRVSGLFDLTLGAGYVTCAEVERSIAAPDSGCLVAVDRADRLLGAATFEMSDDLAAWFPQDQATAAERVAGEGELVGLVHSVAVAPSARSRGVATRLVDESIDRMRDLGVPTAVCVGWKTTEGGCHIGGVMTCCGFEPVCEVDRFWTAESEAEG